MSADIAEAIRAFEKPGKQGSHCCSSCYSIGFVEFVMIDRISKESRKPHRKADPVHDMRRNTVCIIY
jgi:hypothetical protein